MKMDGRMFLTVVCLAGFARAADFGRTAAEFVAEMGPGVVIAHSLDIPSGDETEWGNPALTREQIVHCRQSWQKGGGFRAVRPPVTWSARFDHGAPGHPIEPGFLARVKEIVGWCLAEDLIVVLDVHHDGGRGAWPQAWLNRADHQAEGLVIFADIWRQIAAAFRDSGERLVFEAFNELSDLGDGAVVRYAEVFHRTVRASGGNNARRYLMIPTPSAATTDEACGAWRNPDPQDDHVIVSAHDFTPEGFTVRHDDPVFDETAFAAEFGAALSRLDRHFRRRGIPVVITETAAELQYDEKTRVPNGQERVRWARAYAKAARDAGVPVFLLDTGNDFKTGLFNRHRGYAIHDALVRMFVGTMEGGLDGREAAELIASSRVEPRRYEKSDRILAWKLDGQSYRDCWGETMGIDFKKGNGAALAHFASDASGNLLARAEAGSIDMLHQQFWADQSETAVETMRGYVQTHGETRLAGRKLVFTLSAMNGTTAIVSGSVRFSGWREAIPFGVGPDGAGALKVTPERPKMLVEIPLSDGMLAFGSDNGLNVELKLFPGRWGSHGKLDCMISPVELK